MFLKQREAKSAMPRQRVAVAVVKRYHDWNLAFCKFERKSVFFKDLKVGPPSGTVEFGDDRSVPFQIHLKYPVFIAVKRDKAAIAARAAAFHRVQDALGSKLGIMV